MGLNDHLKSGGAIAPTPSAQLRQPYLAERRRGEGYDFSGVTTSSERTSLQLAPANGCSATIRKHSGMTNDIMIRFFCCFYDASFEKMEFTITMQRVLLYS